MRGLLLLPFLCSAAWSQEGSEIVGARERVWLATLSGSVRADGNIQGTDIDIDEEFNFDNPRLFNDACVWVNLPLLVIDRINVGYWFGEFSDSERVEETFTFGDQTFTQGADVEADLEFDTFSASIEKFIFPLGTDELGAALSIQAGVKYFMVNAELTSDELGVRETRDVEGPLPVLGARFIGQFTAWFRLEVELVGIGGQYGDVRGYYVEGAAEAAFLPVENIMLGLGYKLAIINVENEGDNPFELDFRLGGFFLMIGVKF